MLAPWLPEQGLAMLYALRGVGKTTFALETGHAVASGGQFLGWKAPKPRNVVLLDGEMPAPLLQKRLRGIIDANGGRMDLPFHLITPDMQNEGMLNLSDVSHQEALEKHLEGADLIIVDNIATLCRGGRENDSDSWLPVQQWAITQRARGRSVLFIHHAGKSGQQRGTSAREDVLDTVIELKLPDDPSLGAVFEVHFKKHRDFQGEAAKGFKASLKTDADGKFSWVTEPLQSGTLERVVALAREGLSQKEMAEALGVNKSTISRHFNRAKSEGLLADS